MTLIFIMLLSFAACNENAGNSGGAKTSTVTATSSSTSPSPTGIRLGPQSCPAAVSSSTHWDPIVGKEVNQQQGKVETVSCGYLMGVPSLQALVTFRVQGTGSNLLAYVYDKITETNPVKIFASDALEHGDATISGYNTVLTAQTDDNSSLNKGKPNAELQRDLFREFQWSDSKQTLVPIAFPGLYPDLTRYQAEQTQAQVNQGKDAWRLDAEAVSKSFAKTLLQWPDQLYTTVVSGGGHSDAEAVVKVTAGIESHAEIQLTMNRLENNTNGGLWVVVGVAVDAPATTITSPQNLASISQPLTVTGRGSAVSGVVGTVKVLDHLYTDIGHAQAQGGANGGDTTFTTNVAYTSSFQSGLQEGIVAVYSTSGTNGGLSVVTMVKVLIA